MSYSQIASQIGKTEQQVIDSKHCQEVLVYLLIHAVVCTGKVTPTKDEFNSLAKVLDIHDAVSLSSIPDIDI
jgi:hypothetical protein